MSLPRHVAEQLAARVEEARLADQEIALERGRVPRHEPRAYQLELFETAKIKATDKLNTIIVLPTGAGKTKVAALMIDWANRLKYKIVIFMVDRIPLVFQQARVIEEQCEKKWRVGRFCGDKPHTDWRVECNNYDVVVITAGLLKNALETGQFGLEDVELLIVDEAHHCLKSHPFNEVMKNYYFTVPIRDRPIVFGMTASPGGEDDIHTTYIALQKLMDALDAVIIIPQDNAEELKSFVNDPTVEFLEVEEEKISKTHLTLEKLIYEYLNTLVAALSDHTYQFTRRFIPYVPTFHLPPISANDPAAFEQSLARMEMLLDGVEPSDDLKEDAIWTMSTLFAHIEAVFVAASEMREVGPAASIATLIKTRIMLRGDDNPELPQDDRITSAWEWGEDEPEGELIYCSALYRAIDEGKFASLAKARSPKAITLLNYLADSLAERKAEDRTMIFVTKRCTAYSLAKWIEEDERLTGSLRPIVMVGHGAQLSRSALRREELSGAVMGAPGMDYKKQQEVVSLFKSGQRNVMVSTSIGEEGLDTPACNVVIRYDELTTMTGYIQSRGRARHASSKFVVIDDRKLVQLKQKEHNMMIAIQDINDGRIQVIDKLLLLNKHGHRRFVVNDSKAMLQTYCQRKVRQTPQYTFTATGVAHRPKFRSKVKLPAGCGLSDEIQGDEASNKQTAENRAAYAALVALHKLGCLRALAGQYYTVLASERGEAVNMYMDANDVEEHEIVMKTEAQLNLSIDDDDSASPAVSAPTSPSLSRTSSTESKNESPNGNELRAEQRQIDDIRVEALYHSERARQAEEDRKRQGLPAAFIRLYTPSVSPVPSPSSASPHHLTTTGPPPLPTTPPPPIPLSVTSRASPARNTDPSDDETPNGNELREDDHKRQGLSASVFRSPPSTSSSQRTSAPDSADVETSSNESSSSERKAPVATAPVVHMSLLSDPFTTPTRPASNLTYSSGSNIPTATVSPAPLSSSSPYSAVAVSSTGPWFCDVCQVPASSKENMEQHLIGAPHRKQLARLQSWLPSAQRFASEATLLSSSSPASPATPAQPSSSSSGASLSSPLLDPRISSQNAVSILNEMAATHRFRVTFLDSQSGPPHLPTFSCVLHIDLASGERITESVSPKNGVTKKKVKEMVSQKVLPKLISRNIRPTGWRG